MIAQALGGIGLFLVGMVLVTDSLRAAAGDALRRFLLRFTGGPVKAIASGATVTALVQSSSATTVATIGFVGAGLLTFEQALGLIFGANLGTTATGWIVALVGLKFSVSTVALPLVGVGALIKLFTRGKTAQFGLALSGFGIIFVGLDVLQGGMAGLSTKLTPSELPQDTWSGRLLLLGIGVLLTTVMQSSSAAVATALTALHAGTISVQQAAAMVIGINVGTTVTAGIAAIGGSTAAKRTAFAHLLFNALTGAIAFAVLPAFVWGVERFGARAGPGDATILLAAFHTAFNLLGVVLILPFSARFAAMVTRVIRHRGPHLTRLLDHRAVHQGTVATEAVRQTAIEIARTVLADIERKLAQRPPTGAESEALDAAAAALRETEEYVAAIQFAMPLSGAGHQRHVSTMHALDHLNRLIHFAMTARPVGDAPGPTLKETTERVQRAIAPLIAWAEDSEHPAPVDSLNHAFDAVANTRRELRTTLLRETAAGKVPPAETAAQLEQLRWLEDVAYHAWRLADRLRGERLQQRESTDHVARPRVSMPPEPS